MLRLTEKLLPSDGEAADELYLPFELRKRGRLRARTRGGREVGLFLDRGQVLVTGDLLKADTGELIRVVSAPEPVVTAHADDDLTFAKVCYHLGNRHVPLQIGGRWLRLQPDHVLEALIEHFGLKRVREQAPFEPENGAYGSLNHAATAADGHSHQHHHSHGKGHDHDSGHSHDTGSVHDAGRSH